MVLQHAPENIPTRDHYPAPLIVPGIVDELERPIPIPYDDEGWLDAYPNLLAHRIRITRKTEGADATSLAAREACKHLCRQPYPLGFIYWLMTFGWVLEPRNKPGYQRLPFIMWPRQLELAFEYADVYQYTLPDPRALLFVKKSRDVSGSWFDAMDTAYHWQFDEYFNGAVISADLELAANHKITKSYFFKLFYVLKNQPAWLLPKGFAGFADRSAHAQKGVLLNPENDASFIGVANTPDAERGDKLKKIVLEECGTYDDFDGIYNNCLILAANLFGISSVHTRHGYGFMNALLGREKYGTAARQFEFWWYQVPGRGMAWFNAMKSIMSEEEFQREILMMWLAGTGEFIYPQAQLIQAGHFPFRPGRPTFWSLDDGWDGDFALSVWQKDVVKRLWICVAAYYNRAQPMKYWGQLITGKPSGEFVWDAEAREFIEWNRENRAWNAVFYGDRHGDNTDLTTGISPFQLLAEDFGIFVITTKDPAKNDLKYRRDAVLAEIGNMRFDEHHGAPMVLEALQFSRLPNRRSNSQQVSEAFDAPHIKQPSHLRTTVEYLIINEVNEWEPHRSRGPLARSSTGGFTPPQGRRWRDKDAPRVAYGQPSPVAGWSDAPWTPR